MSCVRIGFIGLVVKEDSMKKILIGLLIFGFLSGMVGATDSLFLTRTLSPEAIKRVDVSGTWGYILTLSGGQRIYTEYLQLQKQVERIDGEIDVLKAKRAATVALMERCVKAK